MKFIEKELFAELENILGPTPEILRYLQVYTEQCHRIDDIIDEPSKREDPDFVLQTFALQETLLSSNFYHQYYQQLYPTVFLIGSAYRTSVKFERSDDKWKLRYADVLRHAAFQMVLLCVKISLILQKKEHIEVIQICDALAEKLHVYSCDDDFKEVIHQ